MKYNPPHQRWASLSRPFSVNRSIKLDMNGGTLLLIAIALIAMWLAGWFR